LFLLLLVLNVLFFRVGSDCRVECAIARSVGLYNNFVIIPCLLGSTFFDPATYQAIVYLPLTYTSIGLRAAAYLPVSQFPWYTVPVLLVVAIALSVVGAYQFAHQQD